MIYRPLSEENILPQRRKGAKKPFRNAVALCAFAPLRERSSQAHSLPDVSEFIETLSKHEDHFEPQSEIIIARAPGRLDVMGGIADYSGSLVLELPIAEATFVALQKDETRRLSIVSLLENDTQVVSFEMPLADFERDGKPIEYDEAQRYFKSDDTQWAAYVAGVFLVLMREREV